MVHRLPSGLNRLGLIVVSSVALSASCFAQTAKQFVAPHILEKSGALVGVSWNPTGGQRRHILSSGGAITTTSAPIDELVSLYDNADVYQWLMTNLTGKPTPTTYTITSLDKSDTSVLQASMTPFQITFPFCDIDSKDPGGLDVVSAGDVSPGKSSVDLQSAKQTAKKQKAWLCSNFRLTIGNLPCSRVSHIDSFTWTRSGITNPGPNVGIDDSLTDMDFTLPASDIAPFIDAFNSVDAVGAPTSFPVKLEYLDADGNTLMTVLMTCSITGIGRDNMFSDPNDGSALYRVSSHHFVGTVTIVK